jgi:hypothetical protein
MKTKFFLFLFLVSSISFAQDIIIFDLDRTIFDPTPRIFKIVQTVVKDLDLDSLKNFSENDLKLYLKKDFSSFTPEQQKDLELIFGNNALNNQKRDSFFDHYFFRDSRFLIFDEPYSNIRNFLELILNEKKNDVKVIFLSGRIDELFLKNTIIQIANLLGYSRLEKLMNENKVEFKLKPLNDLRPTHLFKVEYIQTILRENPLNIVKAIFDDSSSNIDAFDTSLDSLIKIYKVKINSDIKARPLSNSERVTLLTSYENYSEIFRKIIQCNGYLN